MRALSAAVLLLAACGGTLVDHAGTDILGNAGTCGDGQVVCGGRCVAQSPSACGASCSVCGAAPADATEVCSPVGAGGHDGVCDFVCDDGLLRCGSGCCAPAQVASGSDFTCASSTAGEVHCFGAGDLGQLGNGSTLDRATSTKLRGFTSPVSALAAGDGHACAISGTVTKCWGDGPAFGALGTVTDPQDVPSLANATALAAGAHHTCAVMKSNGDVVCVGEGAIAGGGVQSAAVLGGPALDVASSDGFTCALVDTGAGTTAVKCWGNDTYGQLGDVGTAGSSTTPLAVAVPSTMKKISAGTRHACAAAPTTDNQELWCWGSNAALQIGPVGTGLQPPTIYPDSRLKKPVVAVAAGGHATCAVAHDNTNYVPYCWSSDPFVAGGPTLTGQPNPFPIAPAAGPQFVFSAGASHTCYVDASQSPPRLSCFGLGARGRLGSGSIADSATPVLVIDR